MSHCYHCNREAKANAWGQFYCVKCGQTPENLCTCPALRSTLYRHPDGGMRAASFDLPGVIYVADNCDELDEHWNEEEGACSYTAAELVTICQGDERKARKLFQVLGWAHPETYLEEGL